MRILGIDPGINGGIALLDTGHSGRARDVDYIGDLPIMRDKALSWIDGVYLADILKARAPHMAVVERVSAMPKQGVSSSFHFGMAFGSILSVIQSFYVPLTLVTPVMWKRDLCLPGNKDKKAALCRARLLYPTVDLSLEKYHNRAEALLIADWFATKQQKGPLPPALVPLPLPAFP